LHYEIYEHAEWDRLYLDIDQTAGTTNRALTVLVPVNVHSLGRPSDRICLSHTIIGI